MKHSLIHLYKLLLALSVFLLLPSVFLVAQTNFDKYAGNPILPLGPPGEWDDTEAAFAHVLYDGSTYRMWYSGAPNQNTYRIGYATSSDGLNWTKDTLNNPVLGLGAPGAFDDTDVWLPWVLQEADTFKMWYTGNLNTGGIGYITTTDPTAWTRQRTTPVLTGGGSGAWDQMRVLNPIVIHSDTLYQMWYSAESASGLWQTGYATSIDGITWSKHPNNPVLTVGATAEWDAVAALAGTVLFEGGQYHMWYHGTSGDPISNVEIGYATSSDGINWTKHPGNPIMTGGAPVSWDAVNVWFPQVIKEANRYRMWYTGRATGSIDRLGYAEEIITGIKTSDGTPPEIFELMQNYPNPFNPATTIAFTLSQSGFVTLKVYNLLGEEVAVLLGSQKPAGQYAVNFDASALTSGIYYYTLSVDGFKESRKMVLLR